jgi:hypothetical protein
MVRKKSSSTKNQSLKNRDSELGSETVLQDKIMYAMANTSVILMSTMMGAFTQVIGSTMGAMASGMAQAMSGEEASNKVDQEIKQGQPEFDAKMKSVISDLRRHLRPNETKKSDFRTDAF